MKFSFLRFLFAQISSTPPVIHEDLTGKTAIVVGANTGIGYENAKHFAGMNVGRLILACRSQARGQAALEKLQQETGCKTAELWIVDLSSFASVQEFSNRFERDGGRLDILVLNAAVNAHADNPKTKDGWETAFQTNNLSTSLLAFLLLPALVETSKKHDVTPRVVVVSSDMHYMTQFEKSLIDEPKPFRVFGTEKFLDPVVADSSALQRRYNDTKLLNVFFSRAFGARLGIDPAIVVNAVNPGYCYSTGLRPKFSSSFGMALFWVWERLMARTSEEGARQVTWAALAGGLGSVVKAPGKKALNGGYASEMHLQEPSDYVISDEGRLAEEKLWHDLVHELVEVEPKVREIVDKYLTTPVSH